MPILERSVVTAGAKTAFAGLLVLAVFSTTVVSCFLTGATIASARMRATASPPGYHHHVRHPPPVGQVRAAMPVEAPATIVDIAAGVTDQEVWKLVRLAPGEHVVTVDDCPAERLTACALLTQRGPRPTFRDLEVAGGLRGPRRVVLLLH